MVDTIAGIEADARAIADHIQASSPDTKARQLHAIADRIAALSAGGGYVVVPVELPNDALSHLADFDMEDVGNNRHQAAEECWAELLEMLAAATKPSEAGK